MKNRCSILYEFQNIYGFMKLIKEYQRINQRIYVDNNLALLFLLERYETQSTCFES